MRLVFQLNVNTELASLGALEAIHLQYVCTNKDKTTYSIICGLLSNKQRQKLMVCVTLYKAAVTELEMVQV